MFYELVSVKSSIYLFFIFIVFHIEDKYKS